MWGNRVCGAAMAGKVKFNVSFLSIVSWFSLSDVTDGLGTGRVIIYWFWYYFKMGDRNRRKYIAYEQELFHKPPFHHGNFQLEISHVDLVSHES